MKTIKQFLIAGAFLCASVSQAHWFYDNVPYLFLYQLGQAAAGDFSNTIIANVQLDSWLATAPDLPADVLQWVHQKFVEQGIDSKTIKVKQLESEHFIAAYYDTIIISPLVVAQISAAFSSNDQALQQALAIWSTLLDHEIGHIKHQYSKRFMICSTTTAIVAVAALTYLMTFTRCKSLLVPPANMREYFKSSLGVTGISVALTIPVKIINSIHARYREGLADDHAIAQSKSPKALRDTAGFFDRFYATVIKQRCGQDVKEFTDAQREIICCLLDPKHPSYTSRIKKFNDAADTLEAEQTIAA